MSPGYLIFRLQAIVLPQKINFAGAQRRTQHRLSSHSSSIVLSRAGWPRLGELFMMVLAADRKRGRNCDNMAQLKIEDYLKAVSFSIVC